VVEAEETPLAAKEDVLSILDSTGFGGIFLIENYSSVGAELMLYSIVNYAHERGLPVLVEDIFDAFAGYVRHFEVMNLKPPMEHVKVIKIGGVDEVGNVVSRVNFEADPTLYLQKKEMAIERAMDGERYVYVVTGFERILGFQRDVKGIYVIASHLRESLGNECRTTFTIIEGNVIESFQTSPLPLIEGVATSVLEIHDAEGLLRLKFKKSILTLLKGRDEVFLRPADVVGWW